METLEAIGVDNLKNMVNYNAETGIFTRYYGGKTKIIGNHDRYGYLKASIGSQEFRLHRLAWFLTHSEWPKNQIDHINRVKDDNRLCNLREATQTENNFNRLLNDYVGVSISKNCSINKYFSRIMVFDKKSNKKIRKSLGYYATAQEASEVYDLWAQMTQGEFYYG
jgi:hypothetical protein